MDNTFDSVIGSAKHLLILLPSNPNLDEVAAALSLNLSLTLSSTVVSSTPMLVEFNRLVGVNKISKDVSGGKNLSIKFVGYKADNIEKVSYDIENGEFKLTVVPKAGMVSPRQDQIELNYSGGAMDVILLIGGEDRSSFPLLSNKDVQGAKIVHIGTKGINDTGIIELARPASSISEVTAYLIKESKLTADEFDPDTATNLLAGVEYGSQSFTHPYTNADTFALVAELLRRGGRRASTEKINRDAFPAGSIPGEMPTETTPIEQVEMEKAPQSWYERPQIYKGTSTS